ncbi:MAG TPA: tetraacyldisaccharide 4'-kinase [Bacteroidales bacterium]|nr:tetraacyldisaccharide 4'-kinase [Bacteroidales bacterium]
MNLFFKIILSPFSVLYGIITFLRNKCYDWGFFHSESFDVPVISVGNLSAGGTGKSPAIEYLIRLLQPDKEHLATLSRGYGRKTKGFFIADNSATATTIGDEPLQFFQKFKNITVSVCEDRVMGIQLLLKNQPSPEVILLDDAYQHRRVKPGLNILLTDFRHLYAHDCVLPSGRLREFRSGAKRADIIVVTKSPAHLSQSEREKIVDSLSSKPGQTVLFSFIRYKEILPVFENSVPFTNSCLKESEALLFSGIADPTPLIEHLKANSKNLHTIRFGDHHQYSQKDIEVISQKFCNIASEKKVIITTEKDFSRLAHKKFLNELSRFPVYYLTVEMDFSETDKKTFDHKILTYVERD